MEQRLEALRSAFEQCRARPAVFDREMRMHVGQWRNSVRVPVLEVVDLFSGRDEFIDDEGRVVIPLHEPDTAELTGEYVLSISDSSRLSFVFYDFSMGGLVRMDADAFCHAYPSWRLRFWTSRFSPPSPPSFLAEYSPDDVDADGIPNSITGTRSSSELEPFFDDLRTRTVRAQEAARERMRAEYEAGAPDTFLETHGGLANLRSGGRYVDEFGQQVVTLTIPSEHEFFTLDDAEIADRTGLAPGVEVIVDSNGTDALPVEAELFDIDDGSLEVGVYWDTGRRGDAEAAFDDDSDLAFVVGELLNPRTYDVTKDALTSVQGDARKRRLFFGNGELEFDADRAEPVRTDDLNRYQERAVTRALQAADVFCIQSPPWTGRRRTLFEFLERTAAAGHSILVYAPTDHLLEDLLVGATTSARTDERSLYGLAEREDLLLSRVGGRTPDGVPDGAVADPWKADVVATTAAGAARLDDEQFDVAVVAHAGMVSVPAGAIPFAKASRVVLIGDHECERSGPPVAGDDSLAGAGSIFAHLVRSYGDDAYSMLRCQYRMNQAIAAFPNREFYEGALVHGQRNRTWTIGALEPLVAYDVRGEEKRSPSGSPFNDAEVAVVVAEVRRLLQHGLEPDEIGVITPHSAQVGKVAIGLNGLRDGLGDAISIGPPEAFASDSRAAIVVSFTRSGRSDTRAGSGSSPDDGPGLNCLLTRAEKRLVLIGNWDTLTSTGGQSASGIEARERYQRLFDYLDDRGLIEEPDVD